EEIGLPFPWQRRMPVQAPTFSRPGGSLLACFHIKTREVVQEGWWEDGSDIYLPNFSTGKAVNHKLALSLPEPQPGRRCPPPSACGANQGPIQTERQLQRIGTVR